MEYLKLQWEFITGQAWRRASMQARGASASLLGYCFRVENGGRIDAAATWDKRDWMAAADCTRRDVDAVVIAGLARWDGDALIVDGYDHRGQTQRSIQREQGAHGQKGAEHGSKGGRPPKEKPPTISPSDNPLGGLRLNPPNPIHPNPSHPNPIQSMVMETGSTRAPAPSRSDYLSRLQALYPKIFIGKGERDAWQAVLDEFGWDPVAAGCTALATGMRPDKRILLSLLTGWLANHYARQEEA